MPLARPRRWTANANPIAESNRAFEMVPPHSRNICSISAASAGSNRVPNAAPAAATPGQHPQSCSGGI